VLKLGLCAPVGQKLLSSYTYINSSSEAWQFKELTTTLNIDLFSSCIHFRISFYSHLMKSFLFLFFVFVFVKTNRFSFSFYKTKKSFSFLFSFL